MKASWAACAVLMGIAAGCSDGGGSGGGRPDGGGGGPPQNRAWVRFGNLAPDAPALDICVSAQGTGAWGSPLLRASAPDGGLTFPSMSKVTYIDAGSLDFRAVAAGGDCTTPIGQDLTAQQLNEHGTYTIAAVGLLTPGASAAYRLQQYIEHEEAPAAGKARFRFVNVIPNAPPLWDGVVDGGVWSQQFTEAEMPFRKNASGTGIVDGYQDIDPNPGLPLTLRATRPQETSDVYTASIEFRTGVISGLWAIGEVGGIGDQRLSYFVCDETPAADGGTTTCQRR